MSVVSSWNSSASTAPKTVSVGTFGAVVGSHTPAPTASATLQLMKTLAVFICPYARSSLFKCPICSMKIPRKSLQHHHLECQYPSQQSKQYVCMCITKVSCNVHSVMYTNCIIYTHIHTCMYACECVYVSIVYYTLLVLISAFLCVCRYCYSPQVCCCQGIRAFRGFCWYCRPPQTDHR